MTLNHLVRRLLLGPDADLDAQWTPMKNIQALADFYEEVSGQVSSSGFVTDAQKQKRRVPHWKNAWRSEVQSGVVSRQVWRKFLSTDDSGLSLLYMQLEFGWLFMTPPLLFFRFALICPSVLLEPDSFSQIAGIGAMEFAFALFIFFTKPYRSPYTDLMICTGAVHQLFLIGLQSFHYVERSQGNPTGLSVYMLCLTGIYFAVILFLIFMLTMWPLIAKRLKKKKLARKLRSLGLFPVSQAQLYKKPGDLGFKVTQPDSESRPWILVENRLQAFLASNNVNLSGRNSGRGSNVGDLRNSDVVQREERNDAQVGVNENPLTGSAVLERVDNEERAFV